MERDPDLLSRARASNRAAMEAIFAEFYPMVHRIALGLAGRADVGGGVERFVIKQAMRALPAWKDEDAPRRWFTHHTVLVARRATRHQPDKNNDVLIADPKAAQAAYIAFIRALRSLPIQQREAFILHHGERFNDRHLAVAMDCSVLAAGNHLSTASAYLKTIAGENFDRFSHELAHEYQALSPDEALVIPKMHCAIGRHIWPRRIARFIQWIVVLAFLAGLTYAIWKIWPNLEF